jgi:ABC-type glycerol-3-phosphate transport system substrate-binding protein
VSEADRGFKEMGVPYAVEPIPPFADGGTPQVFVGVQGFMISAFSENEDLAKTFLLDYVGTEEVQLQLFEAGGRPPAMLSAFEQVKTDPDVQGFGLRVSRESAAGDPRDVEGLGHVEGRLQPDLHRVGPAAGVHRGGDHDPRRHRLTAAPR